jgi:hypothetical protein
MEEVSKASLVFPVLEPATTFTLPHGTERDFFEKRITCAQHPLIAKIGSTILFFTLGVLLSVQLP